jgi:hypothetical protein
MRLTLHFESLKGEFIDEVVIHTMPSCVVQTVLESPDPLEFYCEWCLQNIYNAKEYIKELQRDIKKNKKHKIVWGYVD